jgi:FixJ family two-component response regulator
MPTNASSDDALHGRKKCSAIEPQLTPRGAHPDLRQCALPEGALHHGQLARTKIQIPIIFVTGHGDIPMLVLAMKAGAVDFLPKPFRDQDMLDAVAAALERDRQRRASETVL